MYLFRDCDRGSGSIIVYYNDCGDKNNIHISPTKGCVCIQGGRNEKVVVPPNTNNYASHTESRGWGFEKTNLQGKVSVYPVGVLSKGGVWGNLLKGGMGACGGIGGCARGFSGKYSIVP